jgi:hypothetical protein
MPVEKVPEGLLGARRFPLGLGLGQRHGQGRVQKRGDQLSHGRASPVLWADRSTEKLALPTLDLSRELYDTRLAPKASFTMKESWKVPRSGLRLRARVLVEPDHSYTRFFQATIPQAERGKSMLREALRQTQRSAFTIFSREVPLQ